MIKRLFVPEILFPVGILVVVFLGIALISQLLKWKDKKDANRELNYSHSRHSCCSGYNVGSSKTNINCWKHSRRGYSCHLHHLSAGKRTQKWVIMHRAGYVCPRPCLMFFKFRNLKKSFYSLFYYKMALFNTFYIHLLYCLHLLL